MPMVEVSLSEPGGVSPSEQTDLENISSVIQTVSVVPTWIPKKLYEQVVIYVSGATYRLYVYDTVNNAWRYAALT